MRHIPIVFITETNNTINGDIVKEIFVDGHIMRKALQTNEYDFNGIYNTDTVGPVEFMSEGEYSKMGINLNRGRKVAYCIHMWRHLKNNAIKFHANVGTSSHVGVNKVMMELASEMKRFKIAQKISGKDGELSDDMTIALLMLVYFSFEYFKAAAMAQRKTYASETGYSDHAKVVTSTDKFFVRK